MASASNKKSVSKTPVGNWCLVKTRDALDRECFAFSLNGQLMLDAERVMKVRDKELAEFILQTLKEKKF